MRVAKARGTWRIGNRVAPPRFLLFALGMIAAWWVAVALAVPQGRALMIGFDIASGLFLVSLRPLLDEKSDDMRRRAEKNDANRAGLLALTAIVTLVILVAVDNELGGRQTTSDAVLVIVTLALAWLFSNTVFALHYAHLFYSRPGGEDARGLDFPNEAEPGYWDFTYFAFTLGMTFQTSDVSIASRQMRRVVTGHCLAAFVFNLGVIAFTINVLGN